MSSVAAPRPVPRGIEVAPRDVQPRRPGSVRREHGELGASQL